MQNEKLVLQDNQGKVLRTFAWTGTEAYVIQRDDNRRLELCPNLEELDVEGVAYTELGKFSSRDRKPFLVGELGMLNFVEAIGETQINVESEAESSRNWWIALGLCILLAIGFGSYLMWGNHPEPPTVEEKAKERVVQIIKSKPTPKALPVPTAAAPTTTQTTPKAKAAPNVKRMGALAVLGSLKSGKQKGGVDIGAIQTSAGPGRGGGTQGSGGVQTSLYGKGLVAAPVGVGGNVQGAGGYGTKGKGGGQAGYGELSLVGAAGNALVPLGSEAVVASGLDRDMIAAVIERNKGQIHFCYEQGLQSNPGIAGRVSVDFTINGNGVVKAAAIGNSTLNASVVEQCILMRLKTWKFPLPQGGVDVSVSYPFQFKRVGG